MKQQARYEKHTCTPRVYKTYKGFQYLKCKICTKDMGKRRKPS